MDDRLHALHPFVYGGPIDDRSDLAVKRRSHHVDPDDFVTVLPERPDERLAKMSRAARDQNLHLFAVPSSRLLRQVSSGLQLLANNKLRFNFDSNVVRQSRYPDGDARYSLGSNLKFPQVDSRATSAAWVLRSGRGRWRGR